MTRAGDLLGSRWAQGGGARPQSLLELRAAADEAAAGLAEPQRRCEDGGRAAGGRGSRRGGGQASRGRGARALQAGRRGGGGDLRPPRAGWRARPGPRATRPAGSTTAIEAARRRPSRARPSWPGSGRSWPRPRTRPADEPDGAGSTDGQDRPGGPRRALRRGPGGRDGSPAGGPHGGGAAARDQRPRRLAGRGRRRRAAGPRAGVSAARGVPPRPPWPAPWRWARAYAVEAAELSVRPGAGQPHRGRGGQHRAAPAS